MTAEPNPRHIGGLLTVRERLDMLFDDGRATVVPPSRAIDSLWLATGEVHGGEVLAAANDPDRSAGSLSDADLAALASLGETAEREGRTLVHILDSGGLRASLGTRALQGLDAALTTPRAAEGGALRLTVLCGRALGAEALLPAVSDLVLMSRAGGFWSLGGSAVAGALFGEDGEDDAYGGASLHQAGTGFVALAEDDDARTLLGLRAFLSMIGTRPAFRVETPSPALSTILPPDPLEGHDADELLRLVADGREILELFPRFAPGMATVLGRMEGRPVGLLASRTRVNGGALDGACARKAARFVDLCARLRLPLAMLLDCPGALPGLAQEEAGSLADLAALRMALSRHREPKAALVVRRAWGTGALAFGLFDPRTPCLRWPGAAIALEREGTAAPIGTIVEPEATRLRLADALRTPTGN